MHINSDECAKHGDCESCGENTKPQEGRIMEKMPKGMRLHIGIFGRRNVGKSSFLNAVTGQKVAIVSDVPGTTTDPVEKTMELLPVGPVLFIDTAGLDDSGTLGRLRTEKTRKAIERTDVGVVIASEEGWGDFEDSLTKELDATGTPVIAVFNKTDICSPEEAVRARLKDAGRKIVEMSALTGAGVLTFKEALIDILPSEFIKTPPIAGDLVAAGELAVLVVPIDIEAPKGRLILPQVQTIRDLLDNDVMCAVIKEHELKALLGNLKKNPALVVTDSQAFKSVAADTPDEIPMTSFSILFARLKGDLQTFAEGAKAIEGLREGAKILMLEACTHHPIGDDIGRVKIPNWLNQYVGGKLDFTVEAGRDFPADLQEYDLVIHCGSCTFNRKQVLSRIMRCQAAGVPITNYGMCIAYTHGIFERALKPFGLK